MSIFRPVKEPEDKGRGQSDTVVRYPTPTPPVPAQRAVVPPGVVRTNGAAATPRPAPTPPEPHPQTPVRIPASAAAVRKPVVPSPNGEASALVAGPGVTLKGSMQCDMLRVEGSIEGDLRARKLAIAPGGTFVGTAEIEGAEIEGHFEGTLSVSGLLVVRATGRLSGKFQYGEIEVERGGAVSGEVLLLAKSKPAPAEEGKPQPVVPR